VAVDAVDDLDVMTRACSHTCLVVASLDEARAELHDRLGLVFTEASAYTAQVAFVDDTRDVTFRYAVSLAGPPYLELIEAVPGTPPELFGAGSHHVGHYVDDVPATADALERRGFERLAVDVGAKGSMRAFALLRAPVSGLVVELTPSGKRAQLEAWLGRTATMATKS
jgi:catechol 2,3-dioxygenase-like lactoylglutathione lyase family enzyme